MEGAIRTAGRAPPTRHGVEGVLLATLVPADVRDTDEARAACWWLARVGEAILGLSKGLAAAGKG
jgi:hypothetical protein